jgi:Secretion system C-terminal sorting domain
MKKILLLFLFIVSSVNLVFSQNPCPIDYKINNGGGSCADLNGLTATGTITLSFDGPIDQLNIPSIGSVYDITDLLNPVLVTGITFGPGTLLVNGDVQYCYYVGPNNNNNLLGGNSQFRFVVSYNGTPCGEQGALPVSFRVFTASRNSSVVVLNWTTSTETNNLGFEIQRLIGSGDWQVLSFLATHAVGGNSSSDLTYTYNDLNLTKGISQYRIKQIDIDRRSKISEIRSVRGDGQKGKTMVYPNPSNDGKVNVVFEDKDATRNVSLMDLNGRVIKQWKNIRNNTLQIENLITGFYTLRIINSETGEQIVEKIVVKNR